MDKNNGVSMFFKSYSFKKLMDLISLIFYLNFLSFFGKNC